MRVSGCVLTVVLAIALCGTSWADKRDDEARAQFKQGIALYKEDRFEQAAIAFSRAYELKPTYKILFNIGQVENELSHYAAALEAYTRYLTEGGKNVSDDRLVQVKSEIKRLNALVGMIVIECPVDGARVQLDDETVGTTPLTGPIFVDVGKHKVVVRSGGEEIYREMVKVAGGQRVTLAVETQTTAEPVEPATEDPPEGKRLWTWVAFGVGGVAAVGAAVTGGLTASRASTLDENCPENTCSPDDRETIDSGRKLALTTDVLIGVAAVGLAAGILLYFIEPGLGEDDESVALLPSVVPGGGGVSLSGRF